MKIDREQLLTSLEAASPGLSPSGAIEQSQCFVFRGGRVYAYNDEVFCHAPAPLNGVEGAVQARPLLEVLRRFKEEEVDVSQDDEGKQLVVSGKGRKAGVIMDKEVLLPIDKVDHPEKWRKVGDDYGEAMMMVQECAGRRQKDYATSCVHFGPEWMEAFDNYQMLRYKIDTKAGESTVVRATGVKVAAGIGPAAVSFTPSWMFFRNKQEIVVGCRRTVQDFFDMGDAFEVKGVKVALPKGLIEAAAIAEVFSSEIADNNVVCVDLRPGKLKVTAQGVSGWYRETKNVNYQGKELEFLISPKLLAQIVSKHSEVRISRNRLKVDGGNWTYCSALGLRKTEGDE